MQPLHGSVNIPGPALASDRAELLRREVAFVRLNQLHCKFHYLSLLPIVKTVFGDICCPEVLGVRYVRSVIAIRIRAKITASLAVAQIEYFLTK